MAEAPVRNILIAGGGVAGWLGAAVLSRLLSPRQYAIRLVDFTPGGLDALDGGEASLPSAAELHARIGLSETALFRDAAATISLGTSFADWPRVGARTFRPFGAIGARMDGLAFHHQWQRLRQHGDGADLSEYALAAAAAKLGKFAPPEANPGSVLSTLDYAYHWHGASYQALLRARAERQGVARIAGEIADVSLRGADGFIEAVTLRDGQRLEADLYIDFSGARGVLIAEALKTRFEDWRPWLPCDRAIALRHESALQPPPFRTAAAADAGWAWRTPLQQSVGCGQVYASAFQSDEAAEQALAAALEGAPIGAPVLAKFESGRREKLWSKNCVAIGAAACVLDPLEPAAHELVRKGVMTLLALLPAENGEAGEADEYNRIMSETMTHVRDFTALRYVAGARADTPFWAACRAIAAPESLEYKMALFAACGRVLLRDEETYSESDWAAAWIGQGVAPRAYSPLADTPDLEATREQLRAMRAAIRAAAKSMPQHAAFIRQSIARAEAQA